MNLPEVPTGQAGILLIIYIAYLCWVMFGGLKPRKIKPRMYLIMTLLMLYGIVQAYDGIPSTAALIDIAVLLSIGFVKGICLGKRKIVEKTDAIWYMHHTYHYIVLWILFFAGKVILTQYIEFISGETMPLWHILLYFSFYYPWRIINVFIRNPQMRKEVLKKKC